MVTELKNAICVLVDAESETGEPLKERFGVRGFPALLFLNPDGSPRDKISGYMPPEPFLAEVQRIFRNEGTIPALKKEVVAKPEDLDLRWAYAQKLKNFGDTEGYEAQVARILKRDPEGKSLAVHTIRFDEAMDEINKSRGRNLEAMRALLEKETYPELLFKGWSVIFNVNAGNSTREKDVEKQAAMRKEAVSAGREAWSHAPDDRARIRFGNSLAWFIWEQRETLTDEDKAFALLVASKASGAAPDNASILDTYACCLFMNGKSDEALEAIMRCMEIDPDNPDWQARLEEFSRG